MPKERIYGKTHPTEPKEQHDLLVTWSKAEQHHDRDDYGYGILYVGVVEQTADAAPAWAQLDRTAVNRAIAALRRARDQAYGRDE